jgi:hypothetical protein
LAITGECSPRGDVPNVRGQRLALTVAPRQPDAQLQAQKICTQGDVVFSILFDAARSERRIDRGVNLPVSLRAQWSHFSWVTHASPRREGRKAGMPLRALVSNGRRRVLCHTAKRTMQDASSGVFGDAFPKSIFNGAAQNRRPNNQLKSEKIMRHSLTLPPRK